MALRAADWKHIPQLVTEGIEQALALDDFTPAQREAYLAAAGEPEFTKTHGRRSVGGLNRVVDTLTWMDKYLDERQLFQPDMTTSVNNDICRPAGFPSGEWGHPSEFFRKDMERVGFRRI